jgi:hypothetical protein
MPLRVLAVEGDGQAVSGNDAPAKKSGGTDLVRPLLILEGRRHFTQPTTLKTSMLKCQTLSDLVNPFFDRVKSGMHCSVVKIEYVSERHKTKNPMVSFHVAYRGLNSVAN